MYVRDVACVRYAIENSPDGRTWVTLARSSQPLVGLQQNRCTEDEKLIYRLRRSGRQQQQKAYDHSCSSPRPFRLADVGLCPFPWLSACRAATAM